MERRRFLQALVATVGGIALEQAIPLGRVWSFPKAIKVRTIEYSFDFARGESVTVIDRWRVRRYGEFYQFVELVEKVESRLVLASGEEIALFPEGIAVGKPVLFEEADMRLPTHGNLLLPYIVGDADELFGLERR